MSAEVNSVLDTDVIEQPSHTETETPSKSKAKRRKKKLTAHRAAYLVHSFIGLKLSLLFTIVLITGAIAVFAEEIDWLFYSEVRVTPTGEKMNEGEVFDTLKASMPNVGLSDFITANDREYTAAQATLTLPEGGFQKVWVNPYTGETQGITNFLTVGEFFSILHKNLYMPLIGRSLVNVFGVLCLIGLISGLISYRRFWREFFTLPRTNVNTRVFLGDLHKFLGLWSLWFVLIIGVSGSWWFYQTPLVRYDVAPQFLPDRVIEPQLTQQDLEKLGSGIPTPLSSKEIVKAVNNHDPEFVAHILSPPQHNGQAYTVRGTKHDLLVPKWTSSYYVHPYTGEIIGKRLAEDLAPISRVDWSMVPLHYGTWGYDGIGDFLVKLVWFVFGVAMTVLSVSGMIIFYKRTKSATQKLLPAQGAKRTAKRSWFILRPWGGPMGAFKYLNLAFIAVILIGINIAFKLQSEGTSGSGYQYNTKTVGDWTLSMNATLGLLEKDLDPIRPGRATTINVFIKEGDPAAIKFMYVKTRKPRTLRAPGSVVHGSLGNQGAKLPIPRTLKENAKLWVTIEDWHGNFYQEAWPLMPDGVSTVDLRLANTAESDNSTNDQRR